MSYNHQNRWTPSSWRNYPIQQQPSYGDIVSVEATEKYISTLPGVARLDEIENLRSSIEQAQLGEAFIIQGGDCAERFMDCREDVIFGQLALLSQMCGIIEQELQINPILIARIAGQYAKPRSNQVELVDGIGIPSYRGDMINHIDPTVHARTPDPQRLMLAYKHSVKTKYIMEQCQSNKTSTPYYCSHEGLVLGYEEALVKNFEEFYYATSGHMLWVGKRTAKIGEAHIEFFRGVRNPIGIKVGQNTLPEEVCHIVETLNPENELGKIIIIPRYGVQQVQEHLPKLIQQVSSKKLNVLWSCDPMHGNTFLTVGRMKTRRYDDILSEIKLNAAIHQELGTRLGGLHFELTAQDVTECLGGVSIKTESDLRRSYKTACDPRLNASQSVQLIKELCSSFKIKKTGLHISKPDYPLNLA